MQAASMLANLIATRMPGPGSVVMGHMLTFVRPIYVGETVTATVEIVSIHEKKGLVRLSTKATTARGLCVDGEAVVKFGRPSASKA